MLEKIDVYGLVPNQHESAEEVHTTLEAVEKYFRDKLQGGGQETGKFPGAKPDFGMRVRQLREALGLSQAEFARRYGLDLATLRGWEQGRRKPDTANRTLLEAIEVSPGIMANIIAKANENTNQRLREV